MAPTVGKGVSLANAIGRTNRDHPKLEAFKGKIGHNQPAHQLQRQE